MKVTIEGDQRPLTTYIAGNPGNGKSSLIQQMALQDITAGRGVCVVDPAGDLVSELVHWIPRERALKDEIIYFSTDNPVPIDFFSYKSPAERQVLTDQLLAIFNLENAPVSRPRLQKIIGTLLDANANPEIDKPGNENDRCSFLDIADFIENEERRETILSYCPHRRKLQWTPFPKLAEFTSIIERMTPFQESPTLTTMFGAKRPKLNIAEVMESRKVLLVDLKDTPTDFFIGSLIVSKFQQATFARREIKDEKLRIPYYLYMDECHTVLEFCEQKFEQILTRARKYKLCLIMANQIPSDLPKGIFRKLGTIQNLIIFSLGAEDAAVFESKIAPFKITAITDLPKFRAIATMGRKVWKIDTPYFLGPSPASYAKYIRKRTVEKYSCNPEGIPHSKGNDRREPKPEHEAEGRITEL